jgi:hypothetical protein
MPGQGQNRMLMQELWSENRCGEDDKVDPYGSIPTSEIEDIEGNDVT